MELLVVITVISILASLLVPALSRAKAKAQGIACLNNLKQLQLSWSLYGDDNNEVMPLNAEGTDPVGGHFRSMPGSWVLGNAQIDAALSNLTAGVLYGDVGGAGVYQCPGDRSKIMNAPGVRRLRSYSLSIWLNGDGTQAGYPTEKAGLDPYIKAKLSQLQSPSETFAFLDEHEQSIDSGVMVVDNPMVDGSDMNTWLDLPSSRHNQAGNLSFADGHVETFHWRFPKRFKSHLQPVASPSQDPQQLDLKDLRRLQACIPQYR